MEIVIGCEDHAGRRMSRDTEGTAGFTGMDKRFLAKRDRTVRCIVACRHEDPPPRLKGLSCRNGANFLAIAHHQGEGARLIKNDSKTGPRGTRATTDDDLASVTGKCRHDEGLEREGRKPVKNRCGGDDRVGTGIDALI